VLSEGHAVPAVYAAAAKLGVMVGTTRRGPPAADAVDDLATLREGDSVLDGHPNPMEGFPFFDAATGSLGQGLSVAAGVGKAARLDGIDKRVYCIIGDGEAREGQIAEALDFIVDHGLNNVLPIFNCNEFGQADRVSGQQSPREAAAKKLEAYGFEVLTIDGHEPEQIKRRVRRVRRAERRRTAKPMAVDRQDGQGLGLPLDPGRRLARQAAERRGAQKVLGELDELRLELTNALGSNDQFTIQPPEAARPRIASRARCPA
jgi:transketolase